MANSMLKIGTSILLAAQILCMAVAAPPPSSTGPAQPKASLGAAYAPCTTSQQCFSRSCDEGPCYSDLCMPKSFCSPVGPNGKCRTNEDCDVNYLDCTTAGRCKKKVGQACVKGVECASTLCRQQTCVMIK